jgi:hypothetical protein
VESGYQVFLDPLREEASNVSFRDVQPHGMPPSPKRGSYFRKELSPEGFQLIDVSPDVLLNIEMLKTIVTAVQTQSTKRESISTRLSVTDRRRKVLVNYRVTDKHAYL